MFDLIDFDFCLSDDALWAKIHLIYFGICTFYIKERSSNCTYLQNVFLARALNNVFNITRKNVFNIFSVLALPMLPTIAENHQSH